MTIYKIVDSLFACKMLNYICKQKDIYINYSPTRANVSFVNSDATATFSKRRLETEGEVPIGFQAFIDKYCIDIGPTYQVALTRGQINDIMQTLSDTQLDTSNYIDIIDLKASLSDTLKGKEPDSLTYDELNIITKEIHNLYRPTSESTAIFRKLTIMKRALE